jgi:uncharacterized protein involved in tolerance to divalent cations
MKSTARHVAVMVTAPNLRTARKLAGAVLDARLVACANFIPGIESHYVWKGKRECTREILLMMKTTRARLRALEALVIALHPYDTPEFVTVALAAGNARYLKWITDAVAE